MRAQPPGADIFSMIVGHGVVVRGKMSGGDTTSGRETSRTSLISFISDVPLPASRRISDVPLPAQNIGPVPFSAPSRFPHPDDIAFALEHIRIPIEHIRIMIDHIPISDRSYSDSDRS